MRPGPPLILRLLLLLTAIAAGMGCAAGSVHEPDSPRAPAPLVAASDVAVTAPIAEIAKRLDVTARALHWALLGYEDHAAALTARFLLPDGRTAHLHAALTPDQKSRIQAKVGHFGDKAPEAMLLKELTRQLTLPAPRIPGVPRE